MSTPVSQANSRMELISEEDDKSKRRHSRSRSSHHCRRGVKHHSSHCKKHSKSSDETSHNKSKEDDKFYIQPKSETPQMDPESLLKAEDRRTVEKAPETSEVQIFPSFKLQDRIQRFEPGSKVAEEEHYKKPDMRLKHAMKQGQPLVPTADLDKRPNYVNSAKRALMSSARGLRNIQGTLASLSSLYVNDMFDDEAPCQVDGCPLNPKTRYISPKGDEPLFSRSSSSSNSSLEVRKTSSLATRKWCICISAAILLVGIFASAGIYFGYTYLKTHEPITERVYRGKFRMMTDEGWVPDPGSVFHTQKAEQFRGYIHQLLSNSALATQYKYAEVFLLESDPAGLLVNFNLHFQSDAKQRVFAKEVQTVLESQIKTSGLLPQLDLTSLDIQEREYSDKKIYTFKTIPKPKLVLDLIGKRECSVLQPGYCSQLPYNITTLPNILGHTHSHQVQAALSSIMSIVESSCYPLSYELMCQFVQPVCYKERIVPPCQAFCQEFVESCDHILPGDILDSLNCNLLPTEADGPGACISKPGCVNNLRSSGRSDRVCDGVVDCPDFSDELYCSYCPEKNFHCGVGMDCIPKNKICDGELDCQNGADEKGCVSLAPRISAGSYIHHYHNNGYVLYQQEGKAGKVCAESLNETDPQQAETILRNLGSSICQALEYESVEGIAVGRDEEVEDVQYVDISSLQTQGFNTVPCQSKTVLRLECRNLECGRRSQDGRNNSDPVVHGDWPWQVALLREGVHVCDGTLIENQWVMSTASCFQGQSKAKWQASVGSVRLSSRAPWEQNRRIVGMVKSPVEGNDIVILKLEEPIVFSDFARPICLPSSDEWTKDPETECYSLGWDSKDDIMRPVDLTRVGLEKCEDHSEVSVNSLCTESSDECQGDIVAGAGLVCQSGGEWHLVGVSSWRRGCGKVGGRPRLYDKVSITTEWAARVISEIEEGGSPPINSRVPRRRLG